MKNTIEDLMASHYILKFFDLSAFPNILSIHENTKKHKRSGYLTIRRRKDGIVLLSMMIGECPSHKAGKYFKYSLEKGERLFHHPTHLSSWQSRDKKLQKDGGAIVAGKYIVSFSGIYELLDEAIVLSLARFCHWISYEEAENIARISRNHFYNYLK